MSQENVQRARRAYEAFNRRDWDAFLALMDTEIVMESRLVAIEGGYRGHDGLRRWWEDFLGTFPDYQVEIEEMRDLGDVTLSHFRGWGHSGEGGIPLIDPIWQPVRWRKSKIVWMRVCLTESEALEAVGLRE
ncbi:MAG TPA: nuclear transport factor 2 family protein [Gemmatimonadales bacterium]|nr:nuclear transport factor 2 family protein [Gemmatimonadales bacterium]